MPELKRPSLKARKLMTAMLAVHPVVGDRPIDQLDKVYTRLMLGDRRVDAPAKRTASKATAPRISRQLQRQIDRLRAKQALIKARVDEARKMR